MSTKYKEIKNLFITLNKLSMKNKVLLVLLLSFAVSLAASAQKITMNLQQVKLEKVFSLITKQTGLTVAYSRTIVNPERIVSVQAKDKDLSKVLDDLFAGTNVAYEIGEKKIYLKAKEAPVTSQGSQKTKKITGTVTDTKGEPVIGASVLVKGAGTGTVTDVDGNFTLDAPTDALLAVSYIGYKTQEVKVGNKNSYSIQLQDDTEVLDEVVVVGYGVQKKSSLTGAVASISSQEISKQVSSNVASSLQGRTPGVDIVQQAGVAGADVNIVIRGAASFGATEPLYVIDGAFSNAGLSSLNPNDIESIEVLKDGAAAAIYGSRAANGVVLITTKKGKSGKPVIQIDGSFAFQKTTNIPEFLNASEWREFANMVADNSGLPHAPENDNPTNPNLNTDWSKEWIQFAPVWNLNASIAGGGDNSTFSTSLGYLDQTGMTIYSDYKRYNFRLNTSYKKGRFSFSETLGLTHKDKTPTTAFNIALPTLPIYDEQGRFTSGGPDYYINPEDGKAQNKIAPLHYTDQFNKVTDLIGSLNAQLDIWGGLKYKLSLSGNYSNKHNYTHTPEYYTKWNSDGTPDKDYGNTRNSVSETRGEEFTYTIDNLLTYNKTFNRHSIDALLGTSWMREYYRYMTNSTINDLGGTDITGFQNEDGKISAGDSNAALLSFFARVNYDYDNKYLLSLSIRRDESSKFHKDNRVGYFPSVSAGWNVHQEKWFQNPVMSKLKIRASYGELGANFLNPYNFDAIAYGPIPYTVGGERYVTGRAAYLKSKDLKWETAKTTDIGIELGFFNNDLTLSLDYFVKKNVDLLAQIDLNLSSGQIFEINSSREKPYVNTASVKNTGWEFMMNYRKQLTKDFHIDATFNIATLKNKVLSLGENVQPITSGAMSSYFNDAASITMPGEAIGSFYGYKIDGFDAEGNFIFADTDKNGVVNANDKVILGSPIPDFTYGLNINMEYKDFDLTVFFQGVQGNDIFNQKKYTYYFDYSNNVVKEAMNGWTKTNRNTGIPIMKTQNTSGGNSLPSEFYIEDGSYLRLKNLQLGYSLPKKWLEAIRFNKLRVYAGVQNLFTLTQYSGYDPEVSSNVLFSRGIDISSYPNARTFTFGFNASF
ncbi:TonB-linked outer membrane protein, SusC/RagA family [Bacteroides ovatus ATCC 8483]|uniref:TonB-linked outer membrane protein, SusC/RagA family n=11 Tax=Pseudomonadati TaxID=3379134 RepID=A0AAN3ACE9_BACO1|nr:TonB-linked outer membrane protein, SusC/RagA family [Bacteroides ovatus ATCC 8483]